MANSYMRNKLTGEIKEVEPDSQEYRDLQGQVTPNGQSMWEQTNFPHSEAIKGRASTGTPPEEDLGHEVQDELRYEALVLDSQGVAPEQNPHLQLTPGEVESGLTPQQKLEDLKSQYDQSVATRRGEIFGKHAENLGVEVTAEKAAAAKGQLARAGGSDDRANVPSVDASNQEGSGADDGVDIKDAREAGYTPQDEGGGDQ